MAIECSEDTPCSCTSGPSQPTSLGIERTTMVGPGIVSRDAFRLKRKQAFDDLPLFAVPQEPDPLVMKLKGMGLDVPSEYLTKYPREVVESAVRYTEGEIAAGTSRVVSSDGF